MRRSSGNGTVSNGAGSDASGQHQPLAANACNNATSRAGLLNGGRPAPAPHLTRRARGGGGASAAATVAAGPHSKPAVAATKGGDAGGAYGRSLRVGLLTLAAVWVVSFGAMFLTIQQPAAQHPRPEQHPRRMKSKASSDHWHPQAPRQDGGSNNNVLSKLKQLRVDPALGRQRLRQVEEVAERNLADVWTKAEQWEAKMLERGMEIERNVMEKAEKFEEMAVDAVRGGAGHGGGGMLRGVGGAAHPPTNAGPPTKKNKSGGGISTNKADANNKRAPGSRPRWEYGDTGYHQRADLAALAQVRQPIAITTQASDTMDAANDFIDMRDLTATLPFANPDGGAWKQGWDVEPTPLDPANPLQVFVIPHAHCDPGWIKTFDDYFRSQTSGILTSVYNALRKDKRRKFIWAEISYFEWWWREQDKATQEETRKLVASGQLEFVTGGWVQPDEANTQRYAIEVQLQEGHDWLRQTFGEDVIPKYGWSIDPFGYSPTMADILKDYGFEGMLIQRVHYAVKKELAQRKHLEFMWRQTYDETGQQDIFTHVMPFYSYDVPHTCGPDPSVCCQFDFARLDRGYGGCPWHKEPQRISPSNVAERARLLLDQYQKKASLYRSNVVLAPLGDDFRYRTDEEAENQYVNYQKIMDYLNDNVQGVQIQFGTLSGYFNAVRGKFKPPVLKGSFFTYADRDEDYWSGYFTSRVFDKALDRKLEQVLYAASAMGASAEEMREPRRSLSLFQHHDGVTGTAKDHVVEDYARYMRNAIDTVQKWMSSQVQTRAENESLRSCWKSKAPRSLGHFACDVSQPTFVFNPLPVDQSCGETIIPPHETVQAMLPCEKAGSENAAASAITFDPATGMMTHPLKEEWMVWKVQRGGAYLFFPGKMAEYLKETGEQVTIEEGGFVVSTSKWKRTIIEKRIPDDSGEGTATVFDFIFKTKLETDNEEWFVRFTAPIANDGIFHTDLNGANFDTHHFRADLPIQSQVFPMPTLASIEDSSQRFTVLSEHAQGTASLQNGSIDVWLDRRLRRDDERGLGQGVRDNVLTRTRLRLLLETENYDSNPSTEFEISKLCKRMWDELNHPLEVFGTPKGNGRANEGGGVSPEAIVEAAKKLYNIDASGGGNVVPFVYMVHKRVDDFKHAIDSLRKSDFPKESVPLIVSHDGHVPEMVEYVETLKAEFNVIEIFHPHACYDHPKSFPGDAAELNEGYAGDTYGNPRSSWATCAKHHWTWMMKHVFDELEFDSKITADEMFIMEEDYVVSPSIYETVTQGLYLASKNPNYFGVVLDITDGGLHRERGNQGGQDWHEITFRTGPMVIGRKTWQKIVNAKEEFCNRDEYNWDWSVVWLANKNLIPYKVLAPSIAQVQHIGLDGMHVNNEEATTKAGKRDKAKLQRAAANWHIPQPFHGSGIVHVGGATKPMPGKPNGGFGHPKDHEHCLRILGPTWLKEA